jgi:hypothetical protein
MDLSANHWMMISGGLAAVVGLLIKQWASRYDLKDAAIDSAWTAVRGKRTADNPTALEGKLKSITDAPTMTGKATKAATTVAGHFVAQVAGLAGLVLILAGVALIAGGYFWR